MESVISKEDSDLLSAATDLKRCLLQFFAANSAPRDDTSALAAECMASPALLPKLLESTDPRRISIRTALIPLLSHQDRKDVAALLDSFGAAAVIDIGGDWTGVLRQTPTKTAAMRLLGASTRIVDRLYEDPLLSVRFSRPVHSPPTFGHLDVLLQALSAKAAEYPLASKGRPLAGIDAIDALEKILSGMSGGVSFDAAIGMQSISCGLRRDYHLPDDSVGLKELAEMMGVHSETVRFLSKTPMMSALTQGDTGKRFFISRSVAQKFSDDFVFAGPLARSVESGVTSFAEKLVFHGARPVSGPGIDGGLGYLFRRSDVQCLDLIAVAATVGYPTRAGRPLAGVVRETNPSAIPFADFLRETSYSKRQLLSLIKEGFLSPVESGKRWKAVTRESFDSLVKLQNNFHYLTLADAANRVNESCDEFKRRWLTTRVASSARFCGRLVVPKSDVQKIEELKRDHVVACSYAQENSFQRGFFANERTIRGELVFTKVGDAVTLRLLEKKTAWDVVSAAKLEGLAPQSSKSMVTIDPITVRRTKK